MHYIQIKNKNVQISMGKNKPLEIEVSNCTEKFPEPPKKHEFCLSAICKCLLLWSISRRGKNVGQRKVKLSKQRKQQTSPVMEYFEKNKKMLGKGK